MHKVFGHNNADTVKKLIWDNQDVLLETTDGVTTYHQQGYSRD